METHSILIVDDEPHIRSRLSRLFHKEGYDTFLSENSAEALDILDRESPSIILSDFRLQVQTGLELLQSVQEKYPEVIRIIFSGEDRMDAVMTGVQEGVVSHFLLKPWDDNVLKETVQNAIKKAEQKKTTERETHPNK